MLLGTALLAAFVVDASAKVRSVDRTSLIDVGLFRHERYAASQATVFFVGPNLFGGLVLLPLYYESCAACQLAAPDCCL